MPVPWRGEAGGLAVGGFPGWAGRGEEGGVLEVFELPDVEDGGLEARTLMRACRTSMSRGLKTKDHVRLDVDDWGLDEKLVELQCRT